MKYNLIADGIELIGATIRNITIENNIVNVEKESKKTFGININDPSISNVEEGFFSKMIIDFEIEITQSENQTFKLSLSLEGAFLSRDNIDKNAFLQLVSINGAAAIVGIARGKIESITSNTFNSGKVVIPFVNVIDYYNEIQ